MTLNPLRFANAVNTQYLRYQLTASRLTDPDLAKQLKDLIWPNVRRDSPLLKGPYVSLSRAFAEGRPLQELVADGVLHPKMHLVSTHPTLYQHQQRALLAAKEGRDLLITTGTGSGKTEAFLFPIIDRCLRLREDPNAKEGVVAIIVYPMNALANDQRERLRDMLAGTGVTFAMYTGDVKEDAGELAVQTKRLSEGASRAEYEKVKAQHAREPNLVVIPPEERVDRKEIRAKPPRILLVNSAILELNLTRGQDLELFLDAPLEFLVVDEAHTNTGAKGAEIALLLRRLKALAKPPQGRITHIATSATIADEKNQDEGQRFVSRLFGCDEKNVVVVREQYQDISWPTRLVKTRQPENPEALLDAVLAALDKPTEAEREAALAPLIWQLAQLRLEGDGPLDERLFRLLQQTDYAHALYAQGDVLRGLHELVQSTWQRLKRDLPTSHAAAELLTYLALGAASELDGVPLLRPKLHYFVKGLDGAGVVFVPDTTGKIAPKLYLSCEKAQEEWEGRIEPTGVFPIVSCPQCGQHHYEAYYQGVTTPREADPLQGGMQGEAGAFFFPDQNRVEKLVLFTDRIVQADDDEDEGTSKHREGYVCIACGAMHLGKPTKCGACTRAKTLTRVLILDSVDRVKSCPVCKYSQGFAAKRYKHPFRALREITVANVHILAQDMLNQAEQRGRKLIIFADNRQEAAFQAGWMRDRARRFRFRQLLYEHLVAEEDFQKAKGQRPDISLGTLLARLKQTLKDQPELARLMAPEVYQDEVVEAFSPRVEKELERFLVIQVLREIASTYKTRASLESWGRLRVHYHGLGPDTPQLATLAARYNLNKQDLLAWTETLLDNIRRNQIVYDERAPIFSHKWDYRYDLVRNRYLPEMDFHPRGMRLEPEPGAERNTSVRAWISRNTMVQDWLRALPLEKKDQDAFLRDVWELFTHDLQLLRSLPALYYGDNNRIKGTAGVYQLDAHRIGVTKQDERHECDFCYRVHGRAPPNEACTRYRCRDGHVKPKSDEEPFDYDRSFLDSARTMVMAEEHTAQVPGEQRTRIETAFKDGTQGVNCLVATPTLELGVDIGALDMVLLRNVPPQPANYWQRAGRAGRRNRMAVIYTYARSHPHDAYFFHNPPSLLTGAIKPPRFNLRNPVMIRKHVHAAILTYFHARLRNADPNWLTSVIPTSIGNVLFDGRKPRMSVAPIVKPLRDALEQPGELERITEFVRATFATNWPKEAAEAATPEVLTKYVLEAPDELEAAYTRLLDRLQWAVEQSRRLARKTEEEGQLDDEERRFRERCEHTIQSLRPYQGDDPDAKKQQRQNYTLSVLQREGFLPGHATGRGHVVAQADRAYNAVWRRFEFDLPRPSAIAIREHVPGNLIYANGGKYKLSRYKFPATQQTQSPPVYHLDEETGAVHNVGEAAAAFHNASGTTIKSLPLVDSVLGFVSHVDDMEAHRFRMPSVVSGVLRQRHSGGNAYRTGDQEIQHRFGQRLTLVNLGVVRDPEEGELGFPICRICGGVRSPRETDEGFARFEETHAKRCGSPPERYALHVETDVDGLLFTGLNDQRDAVNIGETLTLAASHVLEMNRHDLMWVDLPQADNTWQLFLYDPMPGGSGLLQQVLERWTEIIQAATDMLRGCPSGCPTSCHDCLRTYYNQLHHDKLDRKLSISLMHLIEKTPTLANPIEPTIEEQAPAGGLPTNLGEKVLQELLASWGMHAFTPQHEIELPILKKRTWPDLAHAKAKIAIYLDGPHHDAPERKRIDTALRSELEKSLGWKIIVIDPKDLENQAVMKDHRAEIAMAMVERLH